MEAVKAVSSVIDAAIDNTIQARATQDPVGMPIGIMTWLTAAGEILSPWWSQRRDEELRRFWKSSDHIGGAVYTLRTKVTTLPFHVRPRDAGVRAHVKQAALFERILHDSEFGEGWDVAIGRFVEDALTQDNGGFLEVIGGGDPNGPISGPALGVAHLDASRCQRTGHPEFPVIYYDLAGQRYRLHYTRVISFAQMSSPVAHMYGVGFSALSRAINTAQNLVDISVYKQEKLGSRPPRQMLVGSGVSAQEIIDAFALAESSMDASNLGRYSKIIVVGSKNRDIKLDVKDLASVPDGFDEEKSITLGMFTIALAFGVDARELWPASASGATKADAMVQHLKARGKAFGSVIEKIKTEFERKVLPAHLELIFDQQDDEQDAQKADIVEKRSQSRQRDIQSGVLTDRAARAQMLDDGEINESAFDEMELGSGRLPDGQPLETLFASPDPAIQFMLSGIDPDTADELALTEAIRKTETMLYAARTTPERSSVEQVLALLRKLRNDLSVSTMQEGINTQDAQENGATASVDSVGANGEDEPAPDEGEKGYSIEEMQAMATAAARILSRGDNGTR